MSIEEKIDWKMFLYYQGIVVVAMFIVFVEVGHIVRMLCLSLLVFLSMSAGDYITVRRIGS